MKLALWSMGPTFDADARSCGLAIARSATGN